MALRVSRQAVTLAEVPDSDGWVGNPQVLLAMTAPDPELLEAILGTFLLLVAAFLVLCRPAGKWVSK
jgi:hypothetical protein